MVYVYGAVTLVDSTLALPLALTATTTPTVAVAVTTSVFAGPDTVCVAVLTTCVTTGTYAVSRTVVAASVLTLNSVVVVVVMRADADSIMKLTAVETAVAVMKSVSTCVAKIVVAAAAVESAVEGDAPGAEAGAEDPAAPLAPAEGVLPATADVAVPLEASAGDEEQDGHGAVVVLTAGAADAPFTLTTAYVADGARRTSIVDN